MLDTGRVPDMDPGDGIAARFSDWVAAHRSMGGDFEENALAAGLEATMAAYHRGFSPHEAFEIGRQAFYSTLR